MEHQFPIDLNKPLKFAGLELDEMCLVLGIFLLSNVFSWYFLVAGAPVYYVFRKFKKKATRGVLVHYLYNLGIYVPQKSPHPFDCKFYE